MVDEKGPHYFVAFHSPGPKWVEGFPYNEQPEFPSTQIAAIEHGVLHSAYGAAKLRGVVSEEDC